VVQGGADKMAKHSVNVIVKAKDLASRKFAVIGASAKLMGAAFKSAASIARATLAVAFRVVKQAAIGLAVAFAYCTYAALKQEAAEIELASALKMAGNYSEDTMRKLKAQAAAIQDVTTYGDEYVLSLMRIAMTLGVTADKSADAAKAAIALHAGYGGGRGKPEVFLRYYIDALQGTGSSLASYVVEMKKAKTEQEELAILQEAVNKSWEVAKSKADSATGALKQMKNKLGDIAEAIARPFLPAIQSSANAIKRWATENEATITWWANKTYSYVTLIKDVFLDFAKFMKEDWRAALGFAFDSFLKLLKATFHSAVILAVAGGKGIWKGVKEGLLGEEGRAIESRTETLYRKSMVGAEAGTIFEGLGPPMHRTRTYWKLREEAKEQITKGQAEKIIGSSFTVAAETFSDAFKAILEDMPADLRKKVDESWAKHEERLEALGGRPKEYRERWWNVLKKQLLDVWGTQGVAGAKGGLAADMKKSFQAREAGFLTWAFSPGAVFDTTEHNTAKTAKAVNQLVPLFKKAVILLNNLSKSKQVITQSAVELIQTNFK